MAQRETENNTYAKFWGDRQRALWYVMVFSGVVNSLVTVAEEFFNSAQFLLVSKVTNSF